MKTKISFTITTYSGLNGGKISILQACRQSTLAQINKCSNFRRKLNKKNSIFQMRARGMSKWRIVVYSQLKSTIDLRIIFI